MFRSVPGKMLPRLLLNLVVALLALLLTHVFLVRVPNYLVARTPRDGDTARSVAPDLSVHVEAAPWRSSAGAGSGPVPDGVPAAPDRD